MEGNWDTDLSWREKKIGPEVFFPIFFFFSSFLLLSLSLSAPSPNYRTIAYPRSNHFFLPLDINFLHSLRLCEPPFFSLPLSSSSLSSARTVHRRPKDLMKSFPRRFRTGWDFSPIVQHPCAFFSLLSPSSSLSLPFLTKSVRGSKLLLAQHIVGRRGSCILNPLVTFFLPTLLSPLLGGDWTRITRGLPARDTPKNASAWNNNSKAVLHNRWRRREEKKERKKREEERREERKGNWKQVLTGNENHYATD